MSDQEIRFRIVIDDAGVPKTADRVGQGLQNMGDIAQRQGARMQVSAGQTAAAFRQLPAQLTDVATQLAGGQNPLLVLLQQGGQVKDSFGGIGPAARALVGMLTPVGLAIGTVAAATGFAAAAFYQGDQQSAKLAKGLALTGNVAGVTRGQLDSMTQSLALLANTGAGHAREALYALAASGTVVDGNLMAAGRTVLALQRLTGESADKIVASLGAMRSGVYQWAVDNNRAYNFITADQAAYIQRLELQGRHQEAARYTLEQLAATMETRTAPALGMLEKALKGASDWWNSFWDSAKGIGRAETIEDRIDSLRQKIAGMDSWTRKGGYGGNTAYADAESEMQQLQREAARKAGRVSDDAAAKLAEQEQITRQSKAYSDTLLGLESARDAKLLAQDQASAAARRLVADAAYRERTISAYQYTDAIIADERARVAAEEAFAARELDIARRRKIELSPGQLPEQAQAMHDQGVVSAETRVIAALQKRADLEAKIKANAFRVTPDAGVENVQGEFRRIELLNGAYAETDRWLVERRLHLMALDRATAEYGRTLAQTSVARGLADTRDLAGRRLGDTGREQAGRFAAIADQFNEEQQRLEREREAGTITRDVYDQRLGMLRSFYDNALDQEQRYQDARAKIEGDASVGMDRALNTYLENSRNVAAQSERVFGTLFNGMTDGIVSFAMTGKANFGDFARSVVADLIRIALQKNLAGIFGSLFGGGFGSGGGAGGAVNGSAGTADISFMAANGAAFSGGMQAFAMGGIVNRPTLFKFAQGGAMRNGLMGEAGPEAIMPLRRTSDGRLGVAADGGGGGLQVNLQVINQTGTPVQASTRQRSDGGIELLLTAAKQAVAGDIASGQGEISSALQGRYGLRPTMA